MDEHVDMDSQLCRAYWCGNFSCGDVELASGGVLREQHSSGLIGLYLPPCSSELVNQHLAVNA